jgi:hypothetical protein
MRATISGAALRTLTAADTKVNSAGLQAIFRTEGVEVSTVWVKELGEEMGLTNMRGQDMDARERDRGTVNLGQIIHRFGDDLRGKADSCYQDIPKYLHGLSPDHADTVTYPALYNATRRVQSKATTRVPASSE